MKTNQTKEINTQINNNETKLTPTKKKEHNDFRFQFSFENKNRKRNYK